MIVSTHQETQGTDAALTHPALQADFYNTDPYAGVLSALAAVVKELNLVSQHFGYCPTVDDPQDPIITAVEDTVASVLELSNRRVLAAIDQITETTSSDAEYFFSKRADQPQADQLCAFALFLADAIVKTESVPHESGEELLNEFIERLLAIQGTLGELNEEQLGRLISGLKVFAQYSGANTDGGGAL